MFNIKNFIKEFRANVMVTSINLVGYSIALCACIILGTYVYQHLSFDKFNENANRIYRLDYHENNKDFISAATNHRWFEVLQDEIPGIEKIARYDWAYEQDVDFNNKHYKAIGCDGDKEIFDIFSFPINKKSKENFFDDPNSVIISESLATKIFGNDNPIGQTIKLNYGKEYNITAVFEDIPENSSLHFDFYTNFVDYIKGVGERMQNHWLWWSSKTFIMLEDESFAAGFGDKMKPLQKKYIGDWHAESMDYSLQPLTKIHLQSENMRASFNTDVGLSTVYIFCSAALLILIISCINYINLSSAGFEGRKRSVSIKKVIGASRSQLFWQYMTFSVFLTLLCFTSAIILSRLLIPTLEAKGIQLLKLPTNSVVFWSILVGFSIFVGIISGIHPANYISKTMVISDSKVQKSNINFRNALITVQFMIAILLISISGIMKKQLIQSAKGDLGYDHVSFISFGSSNNTYDHYEAMHDELNKIPGVEKTTSCAFGLPGYFGNFYPVQPPGKSSDVEIYNTAVATNFFDVLNIPVIAKMSEFTCDTSSRADNVVLNAEAIKRFETGESVLGKSYYMGETKESIQGIISNFHNNSLRDKIKPVQFALVDKCGNNLVKIKSENQEQTIAEIKKVWEKFETDEPFEYHFVDDLITNQYTKESSQLKLFNLFYFLALFISLIGLFGMVELILKFKIKEIGIRKVNGARTREVLILLNKSFIQWILLSIILSLPVSWILAQKWLESFAYKTEITWWIFGLAGMLTLAVAIITVSWKSWRVASRNPVEALRYE